MFSTSPDVEGREIMVFQRIHPKHVPCGTKKADEQATANLQDQDITFQECASQCHQGGDWVPPQDSVMTKTTSSEEFADDKVEKRCPGCELEGKYGDFLTEGIVDWSDFYASLRTTLNVALSNSTDLQGWVICSRGTSSATDVWRTRSKTQPTKVIPRQEQRKQRAQSPVGRRKCVSADSATRGTIDTPNALQPRTKISYDFKHYKYHGQYMEQYRYGYTYGKLEEKLKRVTIRKPLPVAKRKEAPKMAIARVRCFDVINGRSVSPPKSQPIEEELIPEKLVQWSASPTHVHGTNSCNLLGRKVIPNIKIPMVTPFRVALEDKAKGPLISRSRPSIPSNSKGKICATSIETPRYILQYTNGTCHRNTVDNIILSKETNTIVSPSVKKRPASVTC